MKKQERCVRAAATVGPGAGNSASVNKAANTVPTTTVCGSTANIISSGACLAANPAVSIITSEGVTEQAMGMKHSKSDHSGLSHKDRFKDKTSVAKKFISKSQENLSSQGKTASLTTVVESPQPVSLLTKTEADLAEKNKENLAIRVRERNSVIMKSKAGKLNSLAANMRKASSTQSIDRTSLKSSSSKSSSNLAIKRAQSTQNICKDKFLKKRTSAPADVMAFNAELLANFEKEKKILEGRISELTKVAESRKGEIEKYKYEVKRLKDQISCSESREEMELLRNQNKLLVDRLQELGFPAEQITDSEKLMMKNSCADTADSHDNTSDIYLQTCLSCYSISTDGGHTKSHTNPINITFVGVSEKTLLSEVDGSDLHRSTSLSASEPGMSLPDLCGTPDHPSVLSLDTANWDKQSNKSANSDGAISEASLACLTERILQMEETNYSTTEELQATLQELGDLQDAVNELTEDNTKLTDEKAVLLESLCTQTVKLENARFHLEHLKHLLISGDLPDKSDRDDHLLGLLKSAQEEREELMRKQTEWCNAVHCLESECKEAQEAEEKMRGKYSVLKLAHTSLKAEKEALEKQLLEMKEAQTAEQTEVTRLKTFLENERSKVTEFETTRHAHDKNDLEALLHTARLDKDRAEQKLTDLIEALALSQHEVIRLKDCLSSKEQELTEICNSAKTQMSVLQSRLDAVEKEKLESERKEDILRKHADQLESDCDRYKEEKRSLTVKLQEAQSELRCTKQQKQIMEAELQEISSKHDVESEEWKQFQRDLQTAVVIANNFSQETQDKMDAITGENSQEMDKLRQENIILKQTREDSSLKQSILTNAELKGKVLTSMDRELAALREGRPHMDQRSQSISVKSLIRSIEEQVKSGCSSIHSSHSESRRSSNSSDISIASLKEFVKSPALSLSVSEGPGSPTNDFSLRPSFMKCKTSEKSPNARPASDGASAAGMPSPEGPAQQLQGSTADAGEPVAVGKVVTQISSILKDRTTPRRSSGIVEVDVPKKETPGKDPLASLAKLMKGSKRNALLKWCQLKTIPYSNTDITNFSSSWNDGLGFCALLHSYVPEKIPYCELTSEDKRRNLTIAFSAGESVGIKATLNINDMVSMERPDWQAVMNYVTAIYRHFEVDKT
ncbi:unnamed protein product [Candidula unifasciata]|uniref:Calponin-homology (CH) domain-containing protein n=1 Tax=Candidula unifasciata TaxID=100452 RepID=A0A8S3YW14_9EUPU|nr:unnamed protein product [Candidula unifasciata]